MIRDHKHLKIAGGIEPDLAYRVVMVLILSHVHDNCYFILTQNILFDKYLFCTCNFDIKIEL